MPSVRNLAAINQVLISSKPTPTPCAIRKLCSYKFRRSSHTVSDTLPSLWLDTNQIIFKELAQELLPSPQQKWEINELLLSFTCDWEDKASFCSLNSFRD